jgi:hypothetical protein
MKKQLIIIGITLILLVVGLSGCNENNNTLNTEKNKFLGTWKNTTLGVTTTITLFSDGTCKIMNGNGTWDLQDGKFVMTLAVNDESTIYTYAFSNNYRNLSLTKESEQNAYMFEKQ